MTENCPLCKGEITKQVKDHVLKELGKLSLDPNYKMKWWDQLFYENEDGKRND